MESSLETEIETDTPARSGSWPAADTRLGIESAVRLARREVVAALHNLSVYLMVTLACLVAAVLVRSYLDFVANNGTLVLADPLRTPLLFAVLVLTGYLGLLAAAGLGGARERGTMEVLFYGPVNAPVYVGGKLLGHLATYVLVVGALAVFLATTALLTGIPLAANALLFLAASTIPAAAMIALGLLLGALAGRVRPALALTALASVIFIAVDAGNQIAARQPGDTLLGSAAGLLSALAALVGWISPYSYFWRAQDSLALGNAGDALVAIGVALVYAALLTALAVITLRYRGVQRWRE